MKGGSIVYWRTVVGVVGSTYPGAALLPWASVGFWESRAEWPCSVGIRSERVEAVGAAGRTTWTAVVGLADETSARRGFCGVSLVRSSRRQPSTTACPGGDALPQGGEPHRTAVWLKDGVRILERVNVGKKIIGGSKLFGRNITQALTPGESLLHGLNHLHSCRIQLAFLHKRPSPPAGRWSSLLFRQSTTSCSCSLHAPSSAFG
jgi:hypothetical protein